MWSFWHEMVAVNYGVKKGDVTFNEWLERVNQLRATRRLEPLIDADVFMKVAQ